MGGESLNITRPSRRPGTGRLMTGSDAETEQRTATVTALVGRSIWNRRTGIAGPEAIPRGTRTRTWVTLVRLCALVMDMTEAMRPPIATRGANTLSERPV